MKREFSAGGVVFKKVGSEILWLVRRPTPNPEYRGDLGWSFPKGWIDDGSVDKPGVAAAGGLRATEEQLQAAAVREVREEGGVIARAVKKLPTVKIFFTDKSGEKVMKFITYFVMEYLDDALEGWGWETEEAKWVGYEEAQKMLAFSSEKKLIKAAKEVI